MRRERSKAVTSRRLGRRRSGCRWTPTAAGRSSAGGGVRRAKGEPQARVAAEIAVPVFGTRTISASTVATALSVASQSRTPLPTTAASSASCSIRKYREQRLGRDRRSLSRQRRAAGTARAGATVQRPKPRGKPTPAKRRRGNATRARVRIAIEHVFAAQKCRFGLVVRPVGLPRATTKLGLANLVTTMRRLVWFETRAAPT